MQQKSIRAPQQPATTPATDKLQAPEPPAGRAVLQVVGDNTNNGENNQA
jgi:hypothetical protein